MSSAAKSRPARIERSRLFFAVTSRLIHFFLEIVPCRKSTAFVCGHTLMAEWSNGNFAGAAYRADLGRRGFHRAFCYASHWRSSFDVVHAIDWVDPADDFFAVAWWLGASGGWYRMAALGLGFTGGIPQCRVVPSALPRV